MKQMNDIRERKGQIESEFDKSINQLKERVAS